MSVIRPLQPRQERHVCPDCGAPEGLFKDTDNRIICKLCDWKSPEPIGSLTQEDSDDAIIPEHQPDIRDLRNFGHISYYIRDRDRVTVWGRSAYESALDHIRAKNWDDAVADLYRALDMDPTFMEVHLWLGRLLLDEKKQREHLLRIIKMPQAMLEMMYLNGQLSLTQLENALNGDGEVEVKTATDPVTSETVILTCPICGGHMTTHPITGHVECAYCGHIESTITDEPDQGQPLQAALWLKQAEGVRWVIEQRMIHCDNCGAERTLTGNEMGAYCLYCGSKHIIVQDALNAFRQPDGILPFRIPQEQAEQAIYQRLYERWERFKGIFINNAVKQATFTGMFLPFWVFNIPIGDPENPEQKSGTQYAFPAVISPSPRLIDKINYYDLSSVQQYDPSTLARYSAEMYQIDFDKASLEVRGYIRRRLSKKYSSQSNPVEVAHRWSIANAMTMRLILLPVWVATLIEDDDDVRIGLVNGQTGRAVLGKARKPHQYL